MLGGPTAVARASTSGSNDGVLQCSLRPDDPLSHPLFGIRSKTAGFLLKITSRRQSRSAEGGAAAAAGAASASGSGPPLVSAEVVGTVAESYRFEGLADYQYVSDRAVREALDNRPRRPGEPFDILESLAPLEVNAMRIPPALFSRV